MKKFFKLKEVFVLEKEEFIIYKVSSIQYYVEENEYIIRAWNGSKMQKLSSKDENVKWFTKITK